MLSYDHQDMHGKTFDDQLEREIAIHGIVLWTSMGFLMPLGILVMRLSLPQENRSNIFRLRCLFYIHVILQVFSVSVATAGAIQSIRSFENTFNNNHQRIGVLLYCLMCIQAIIGLLRPRRGTRRRRTWYLVHWILGTSISVLGMINIYTGIMAYHEKSHSKKGGAWLWNILFTAQLCLIVFLYLSIEKWDYLQHQKINHTTASASATSTTMDLEDQSTHSISNDHKQQQLMVLEPACGKANALKNLFD